MGTRNKDLTVIYTHNGVIITYSSMKIKENRE